MIEGNLLYVSWYQAGAQVFDIADPKNPTLGRFDTFSGPVSCFDGNLGVYPFLGSDRILASDIDTGLYVLSLTGGGSGGTHSVQLRAGQIKTGLDFGNKAELELSVQISAEDISENGGSTTANMTRSGSTSGTLVAPLTSDDTTEATAFDP